MKKIAVLSDFHCGHKVGLTPKGYLPEQPVKERAEWVTANRAYYNWYALQIARNGPYDIIFLNGDLVDGRGAKSGGTELITTDMEEQCDMAVKLIREIPKTKNCKIVITRGTPYHTGNEEDWENNIAQRVDARIGEHEWVNVEDVIFDLKHHPAGSSNLPHGRHTAVARDRMWNIMWAERELQPKADIFIRSHVHYHNYAGGPDWLAMTTPALQGFGCLTAGHKILTADLKWVNVETLKAGDKLLAFEEEPTNKKKRNFVLSEVLANEPIKQHVYDVLLSDGTKITATGNHPFLTQLSNNQYKWRTVIDLKNNLARSKTKRIVFKRFMPVWEEDKSYEGGYLSGFFDSEGCLCQAKHGYNGSRIMVDGYQNVITAKQKGNPCYDFAIKCLESLGIKHSIGKHKNCHAFRICGGLTNILMFLGKIRPKRLLEQLEIEKLGSMRNSEKSDNLEIVSIEYAGEQIVWGLGTSSKTYISDGFLSHNSRYGARRCTGIVDFGFVIFTVNKGTYTWQPIIAKLAEQKAPMLKL